MLTASQLKEYLAVMREAGCSKFEQEGLLIEMAPAAPPKAAPGEAFNDMPMHPDGRPFTDEDWMLAATEGIPMGPNPAQKPQGKAES